MTTETLPSWATMDWTKRISERPWHGHLTDVTAEGIAKAITNILTGKTYAVTKYHDHGKGHYRMETEVRNLFRPDWVDKDQSPIKWYTSTRTNTNENEPNEDGFCGISFSGRSYLYIFNSRYNGHPCTRQPFVKGGKDNAPWVKLEHGGFTIEDYDYDGFLMVYVFKVWDDEPFDTYDCEHYTVEQLEKKKAELAETLAELNLAIGRKKGF